MTYNSWKLMDKVDIAVRTGKARYDFSGYVVEHGDEKALESAKDWARTRNWDDETKSYTSTNEPNVHTFDNNGFTLKILDSASGSSQGGRLSFWKGEVEKDGIKFTIGINDTILADLIRNSDIKDGVIKQQLMFVRKGGQPGLIHRGMEAYKEAVADMEQKAKFKSAKKTNKWVPGGIYSTLTQEDLCLGEAWDTMEEVPDTSSYSYYRRTKLVPREKPVKVMIWAGMYKVDDAKTVAEFLEKENKSTHTWFYNGKPPARSQTKQLELGENYKKLFKTYLSKGRDARYVPEV